MQFPSPLLPARIIKRYQRFLLDAILADGTAEGTIVTAHCANSGSMWGVKEAGLRCWLSPAPEPTKAPARKLQYTLELVEDGLGALVGLHTGLPNKLVLEALTAKAIPELANLTEWRPEVKYGNQNSRIDILGQELTPSGESRKVYIEVKNVHMRRPDRFDGTTAEFPDAVTARGTKHLEELMDMMADGHRSVLVFVVQRMDCKDFAPAEDIDPVYAKTLKAAISEGLKVLVYACDVSLAGITLKKSLPLRPFPV